MTPDELRSRRRQLGLSQAGLAVLLTPPTTAHTVSRWEEGKIRLSVPRSLWLDGEMKRVERERRPKRTRTRQAQETSDG